MTAAYQPYSPRPIAYHGLLEHAGHRLKLYTVRLGSPPVDLDRYRDGIDLALSVLPAADPDAGRPGLGFFIIHRGRGLDYAVLGWWERENELPVRVFVRADGPWRPARYESFCVWDLEIVHHERNAYVRTVLADDDAGPEDYLERTFEPSSQP